MNKWFKLFLIIFSFALISVVVYFILRCCGIANISALKSIILKSGKWAPIVYTIVLVLVLVCFCFIPLLNTALAVLGIALFGSKIALITNLIAIFFSTSILFFIGDKFGEKFARKIVGKKEFEETQNLLDVKSKLWLPVIFIIPGIPDEAICLVAGMTKIKYWYLMIVSLIYHAFEIGLFCFIGSDLISWSALTLFDWIIFANIIIIDIYLIKKLEKFLENKMKNK